MSEQAVAAAHDEHEDPMSHVPPPSFWPLIAGIALVLFCCAFTSWVIAYGPNVSAERMTWMDELFTIVPPSLQIIGGLVLLFFALMGWGHQIIREKRIAHDLLGQQRDLKLFIKLFLVSEFAAFAAIFAYFYIRRFFSEDFGTPEHIHLGGPLVAFATFLLLSSSVTCEVAHHALAQGKFVKARLMMIITMLLGVVFLGLQGFEYGELMAHHFWPTMMQNDPHNSYATIFFVSTGFHGLHVLTGLVMLFLVYLRLEMSHFTKQRHFSFIAASWYWHFVDIVWVLLFITVYVV